MEVKKSLWKNPIVIIGILALITVLGLTGVMSYMTNSSKTKSAKVTEENNTDSEFKAVYDQAMENLQVIIDVTKIPDSNMEPNTKL